MQACFMYLSSINLSLLCFLVTDCNAAGSKTWAAAEKGRMSGELDELDSKKSYIIKRKGRRTLQLPCQVLVKGIVIFAKELTQTISDEDVHGFGILGTGEVKVQFGSAKIY